MSKETQTGPYEHTFRAEWNADHLALLKTHIYFLIKVEKRKKNSHSAKEKQLRPFFFLDIHLKHFYNFQTTSLDNEESEIAFMEGN